MTSLLNTIGQAIETLLKGVNTLANADLRGLEVLGLLLGAKIAITEFKKLIHHGW